MSAHANATFASMDWQRVTAFSTAIALHVLAIAILAIPMAMPLPRLLPKVAEVRIFDAQPPPTVLPVPAEPLPPTHTHVRPAHVPVVAPTIPHASSATMTSAIDPQIATAPIARAPADSAASDAQASSISGETRTLAYDGALKLQYPTNSARQREQGTVLLRVLVDAGGAVQRIEVERSSGHPQLDIAAREAVQHAHFKPVLRDGEAVPAWGLVPIEFRLQRL
ncbi:MAG: TonB family protein [Dokdonella sp.]